MYLKPSEIRFSQDSINDYFAQWSAHSYKRIGDTLDDICEGRCSIHNIPTITVVNDKGNWITADNRRLWVFRELERLGKCDEIPVKRGYYIPESKRTSYNDGTSIHVRRDPGGRWHNKPTVVKGQDARKEMKQAEYSFRKVHLASIENIPRKIQPEKTSVSNLLHESRVPTSYSSFSRPLEYKASREANFHNVGVYTRSNSNSNPSTQLSETPNEHTLPTTSFVSVSEEMYKPKRYPTNSMVSEEIYKPKRYSTSSMVSEEIYKPERYPTSSMVSEEIYKPKRYPTSSIVSEEIYKPERYPTSSMVSEEIYKPERYPTSSIVSEEIYKPERYPTSSIVSEEIYKPERYPTSSMVSEEICKPEGYPTSSMGIQDNDGTRNATREFQIPTSKQSDVFINRTKVNQDGADVQINIATTKKEHYTVPRSESNRINEDDIEINVDDRPQTPSWHNIIDIEDEESCKSRTCSCAIL